MIIPNMYIHRIYHKKHHVKTLKDFNFIFSYDFITEKAWVLTAAFEAQTFDVFSHLTARCHHGSGGHQALNSIGVSMSYPILKQM